MKYIKLFEEQEEPKYSIYDIIIMTPEIAVKVLLGECTKDNPDMELVKNILEFSPVDVNLQDSKGSTALINASYYGHTEIVRMLLERPEIDVNLQTEVGRTALILASREGYLEIVRMLLEKPDILVNLRNHWGHSALTWASEEDHTEIANLIKAHPNSKKTL